MAEEPIPDWMQKIIKGDTAPSAGPPAKDAPEGKPTAPLFTHTYPREEGLPPGPPLQQTERTHEGLMHGPMRLPEGAATAAPVPETPRVPQANAIADDPAQQSWMNKDPMTWWPRDSQERVRWRKMLSNQELVEWTNLVKEQSYWHLATRDGRQPANTYGSPDFRDFMRRKSEFMTRTVPRWRQHEKANPPRTYRPRMSAVEALGGLNSDEIGVG